MTAVITIRITCDGCSNFKVLETESVTSARRILARYGWKVVLRSNSANNGRTYGDKCPDCPAGTKTPRRYAEDENPASKIIGDALPKRRKT